MKTAIPTYLTEKHNVVWTVCGTALFAELFILIYQPFGSGHWTDNPLVYIGMATAVVLTAMGIIAISRTIMYKFAKKHEVYYWQYAIWIVSEVMAMTFVYSLTALFISNDYSRYDNFFNEALLDTVFILFIPYSVAMMLCALSAKNHEIAALKAEIAMYKEAETPIAGIEGRRPEPANYNFRDEKGELKLSIRSSSLYYIESADNYVIIYYQNGDKTQHYVLRNTLKHIEEEFGHTGLLRCHRSYVVNFNAIKVLSKTNEGLMIDFGTDKLPKLPISKTYSARFLAKFA